eukprot:TCONS_00020958-protein
MLIKTEKLVHIKKNSRNFINVVREHYLRDDIPCKSSACYQNCVQPKGLPLLTDEQKTTHYVIPDITCCRKYLEILELKELTNIIFLQSVVQQIKKKAGKRVSKNITGIHKNPLKSSIVFDNEFHQSCYVQRKEGQDLDEWFWKNVYSTAQWFHQHLQQKISIIILTECEEVLKYYGSETPGIFVMSMTDYINGFWPDLNEAKDLMESLSSINDVEELNIGASICKEFHEYFPNQVLEAGIKSGRFFANYLKVNKHRPMMEAFIQKGDGKISSSSTSTNNISQVLIHGTAARNRAVDGDSVVVELLPESQWKSRSTSIHQHSESNCKCVER